MDGEVASSNFSGGIVAYLGNNNTDVSYSTFTNQVATIKNCYNNSFVSGITAGGILGYAENVSDSLKLTVNLINCVNMGNVVSVGMDAYIEDAYISGNAGGILGVTSAYSTNFINCFFGGTVKSYINDGAIGGILGALGMELFNQEVLNLTFDGCKVFGELVNAINMSSYKIGALVGSSASKVLTTANITEITKTHYLTKYKMLGKNYNNEVLSTYSYDGASDNAYVFNTDYFAGSKVNSTYVFDGKIVGLLTSSNEVAVSFKVNGEIVQTKTTSLGGAVEGFQPTRESTEYYNYEFLYWDTSFNFVTEDIVVTAVFKQVKRTYIVTYKDEDLIYAEKIHSAGETVQKPKIEKESDFFYDYEFIGWDYDGQVLKDMEVNAVYKKTMKLQGKLVLILLLAVIFIVPIAIVIRNDLKKKRYS